MDIVKKRLSVKISLLFSPIKNGLGELIGLSAIYKDVTWKVEYEQELIKLERMSTLGQMAAGIAHEIRNPMTTVRGFLQLMLKEDKLKYKDYIKIMIEELDGASNIISEFLSITENEETNFKQENLNSLLLSLLPLLEANAVLKNKFIEINMEDIPLVKIDAYQIRQLIIKLVENALESMETGGVVEIRTYLDKNKVSLSIIDQGPEIPTEILNELGSPFQNSKEKGSGLGLFICYQIAERHDAKIRVNSAKTGTEFIIEFNREC